MRSTAAAPFLAIACLLPVLLIPSRARAQPSETKVSRQAQDLFDQANAEMDAGQFQSACPKLERVVELEPDGLGARLALAECYEGMSEPARAWQTCHDTRLAAQQAKNVERARDAANCTTRLEPKIARVVLKVPEAVRSLLDLEITLDGARVGASRWGAPVVVTRGEHVVVATARGKLPWRRSVTLQRGAPQPIEVEALADAPPESSGINGSESPSSTNAGTSVVPSSSSQARPGQEGTASASTVQQGVSAEGTEHRGASPEREVQQGTVRQGAAQQRSIRGATPQSAAQRVAGAPLTKRASSVSAGGEDGIGAHRRALGTIALGLGGAGAFVGTVLGTIALRVEDKGNGLGTASLFTLVSSGVLLTAGGVLILTSDPSGSGSNIALNPQGVSAELRW
ncbi:tetratricopeptide repeat protein [Sorangium sp. So ce854]|uniref:tetratricopeptide repeat protein n=1 Tax=Sorangium sp. So ce854 TaxID=3133322 RepID=UPI003F60CACC